MKMTNTFPTLIVGLKTILTYKKEENFSAFNLMAEYWYQISNFCCKFSFHGNLNSAICSFF